MGDQRPATEKAPALQHHLPMSSEFNIYGGSHKSHAHSMKTTSRCAPLMRGNTALTVLHCLTHNALCAMALPQRQPNALLDADLTPALPRSSGKVWTKGCQRDCQLCGN